MGANESLLQEFDEEMAKTRSLLERVPEDRMGWKPHPKSSSLGRLASHLTDIPRLGARILGEESFDVALPRDATSAPSASATRAELLERFDTRVGALRDQLAGADPAALATPWSLRQGDRIIFSRPRSAAFRTMLLSHMIHHRGQLTVYLRLNDVPLPPLYGPTADEGI
jgi:uncharacterized damage-inducible protein DinB